jgi:hypothetical protein
MFHGNGYTPAERVVLMTALRCADVTLQHGYCYFVITGAADVSRHLSYTTPGYATTHSYAAPAGSEISRLAVVVRTRPLCRPEQSPSTSPAYRSRSRCPTTKQLLEPSGALFKAQKARPKDAAFLSGQSLRQFLGIR